MKCQRIIYDIDTHDLLDGEDKPPIRKVDLVHIWDRCASGALLLTYADEDVDSNTESVDSKGKNKGKGDTAQLIAAMASDDSI